MSRDLIINHATWEVMRQQGSILVRSGFLPNSVKTPEQAIAIMMKGYELGMQPMQAFAHINVIQGKPTISSEGMLSQIWKSIPNAFIDFVRVEDDYCEIHAARPQRTPRKFIFQKSDAEKAGLTSKDNWKKYPRAMYKARCISEMARTIFPDALMGCSHTAEELNPDIQVTEEGEIIEAAVMEPKVDEAAAKAKRDREAGEALEKKMRLRFEEKATELGIDPTAWDSLYQRMKRDQKTLKDMQSVLDELLIERGESSVAVPSVLEAF